MLITCPEYGRQISNMAKTCPNCGVPISSGGQIEKVSGLKRSVALVLALFLGILGAHNRYLGYNKKANIELVVFIIGLLLCAVGIGAIVLFVLWLWSIIEVLTYKTDAEGETLGW